MQRLSKDALLSASDLREKEVELPSLNASVVVQGLGSAFSSQASSEALEMTAVGGEQKTRVNTVIMEEIQILHGLKEPKLANREEARQFLEKNGPAARAVIAAIDELSGVDKEAIEAANARFQGSGHGASDNGQEGLHEAPAGSGGSDLSVRDGGEPEQVHSGADDR